MSSGLISGMERLPATTFGSGCLKAAGAIEPEASETACEAFVAEDSKRSIGGGRASGNGKGAADAPGDGRCGDAGGERVGAA